MKQRVLVVDDDRLVADTLKMIFDQHGFESQVCYSVAEALACARDFDPGVVLTDVSMPKESGLDLAERLHEQVPSARVLMISAYSSNEAKVHQKSEQLRRPLPLLTKPCKPERLLREVQRLFNAA